MTDPLDERIGDDAFVRPAGANGHPPRVGRQRHPSSAAPAIRAGVALAVFGIICGSSPLLAAGLLLPLLPLPVAFLVLARRRGTAAAMGAAAVAGAGFVAASASQRAGTALRVAGVQPEHATRTGIAVAVSLTALAVVLAGWLLGQGGFGGRLQRGVLPATAVALLLAVVAALGIVVADLPGATFATVTQAAVDTTAFNAMSDSCRSLARLDAANSGPACARVRKVRRSCAAAVPGNVDLPARSGQLRSCGRLQQLRHDCTAGDVVDIADSPICRDISVFDPVLRSVERHRLAWLATFVALQGLLSAMTAVWLVRWLGSRRELPVHRPRGLAELEYHWSVVYVLAAGILLAMAGQAGGSQAVLALGIATVACATVLLAAQGLGVLTHALRRSSIGPFTRFALWVTIVLLSLGTGIPVAALAIVGAVDTIRDLRGIHRPGPGDQPAPR